MKYLIMYHGDHTVCVEGFPKDCKRSCKGSLHVNPKKPKAVSKDEYEYIKSTKAYSFMAPKLKLIAKMSEEEKVEEGKEGAKPAPSDSEKPDSLDKGKDKPDKGKSTKKVKGAKNKSRK